MRGKFFNGAGSWIVTEGARFSPAASHRPGEPLLEATSVTLIFEREDGKARRIVSNAPLDWHRPDKLERLFEESRDVSNE